MRKATRSTITCAPLRSACRRASVSLCKTVVAMHLCLALASTVCIAVHNHPWSNVDTAPYIRLAEELQTHTVSAWTLLGAVVWITRAAKCAASVLCGACSCKTKNVVKKTVAIEDKPPVGPTGPSSGPSASSKKNEGIRTRHPARHPARYPTTHSLAKKR